MRMGISKGERGQILALTIVCMSLLLAFVALAVDVGLLFREKRAAQIAADSAAIAAAMNYQYKGASYATNAADTAAAANGFPNASDVVVTPSPTDGYHTGAGYIEVDIVHPTQTTLLGMFGFPTVNVGARAVAGTIAGPACIYVLDPTDASTLYLLGNASITAPDCGIQVNSSSQSAFCDQGSASVDAPYIRIVGAQSSSGKCGKSSGAPVITGVAPVTDPFDNLLGPQPTGANPECTGGNTVSASTVTASTAIPSTSYTSGGTSAAVTCFSAANVSISGGVTLGTAGAKQIFVFENGVKIGGNVTVNGTIDVYQGTFSQGNSSLTVNAPADKSATYNGIAIMQPSSNTTAGTCKDGLGEPCIQIQFGSGDGSINGIIYAPTSQVYQQDHGGSTVVSGVIAYQIYLKASDMGITENYSEANPTTSPLTKVALVE